MITKNRGKARGFCFYLNKFFNFYLNLPRILREFVFEIFIKKETREAYSQAGHVRELTAAVL